MLKDAYNGQNREHCVAWIIPQKIYPDFALRGILGAGSIPLLLTPSPPPPLVSLSPFSLDVDSLSQLLISLFSYIALCPLIFQLIRQVKRFSLRLQ